MIRTRTWLLRFGAAALCVAALAHAQGRTKSPTCKVYVADTEGDAEIDIGTQIDDLTKKAVYNAQGTVIETKPNSNASVVLSNGTGVYFDVNTRVELREFSQESFRPNRTDIDEEPSVSRTHMLHRLRRHRHIHEQARRGQHDGVRHLPRLRRGSAGARP